MVVMRMAHVSYLDDHTILTVLRYRSTVSQSVSVFEPNPGKTAVSSSGVTEILNDSACLITVSFSPLRGYIIRTCGLV